MYIIAKDATKISASHPGPKLHFEHRSDKKKERERKKRAVFERHLESNKLKDIKSH